MISLSENVNDQVKGQYKSNFSAAEIYWYFIVTHFYRGLILFIELNLVSLKYVPIRSFFNLYSFM